MGTSAIITLRETLEASLLIALIITVLDRSGARRYLPALWAGVGVGVLLSMIAGIAVYIAVDRVRDVVTWFAPLLLVGACGLLIWLLVWMHRPGRGLKIAVAAAADTHIQNGSALGIFLLALTTTLREGVETAVFLATLVSPLLHWSPIVGAIIGMAAAMLIASLFMRGARAIPLRYVFSITTALLVLAIAHMAWEVVERA